MEIRRLNPRRFLFRREAPEFVNRGRLLCVCLLREMAVWSVLIQSYTSKGVGRQGIGSFASNSYVSALRPVVLCPPLRASDS